MPSLTNGKRKSDPTLSNGPTKKVKLTSKFVKEAASNSVNGNVASEPEFRNACYIVTGSYERIMVGLELTFDSTPSATVNPSATPNSTLESLNLKPIFSFPAHQSCIKSVAISPNVTGRKWLVSGGTDETIKIWDLGKRKEVGVLNAHEGIVTKLNFPSSKFLLTASNDATLSLFSTKDWVLVKTMKGHHGRVNHLSVHPQGRVVLSVGKDRTMRMWNLFEGKVRSKKGKEVSTSMRLGAEADKVIWSHDGTKIALIVDRELRLYDTSMNLIFTLETKSRFQDVQFCSESINGSISELMLVGCEDGKVRIYRLNPPDLQNGSEVEEKRPELVAELIGHKSRIKAIKVVKLYPSPQFEPSTLIVTISSDGFIFIYPLPSTISTESELKEIEPLLRYDTKGLRLVCLDTSEFLRISLASEDLESEDQLEATGQSSDEDSEKDSDEDSDSIGEIEQEDEEGEEEWGGIDA